MPTVSTSIEIAAPPAAVWEVFSDFDRYPEWNPFMIKMTGEQKVGATMTGDIKIPKEGSESTTMSMFPIIHTLRPNAHLHWRGRLFQIPWLFTGNHHFMMRPSATGTRFENTEHFSGILALIASWIAPGLYKDTQRGFEMMNEALKERVEGKGKGTGMKTGDGDEEVRQRGMRSE